MQLFRLAGHVVLRHRGLLALYVVMLGAFGWLMASYVGTESSSYEAARPTIAVIDRDGSAVSEALSDYAAETPHTRCRTPPPRTWPTTCS